MKEQILEAVERGGGTSFAELLRIEGFSGDLEMMTTRHNIVLWSGLSREAVDALNELMRDGVIIAVPSSLLVYLCDGHALRYPIAKRMRDYKKPHWLPTVFWTPKQNPRLANTVAETRRAAVVREGE